MQLALCGCWTSSASASARGAGTGTDQALDIKRKTCGAAPKNGHLVFAENFIQGQVCA